MAHSFPMHVHRALGQTLTFLLQLEVLLGWQLLCNGQAQFEMEGGTGASRQKSRAQH